MKPPLQLELLLLFELVFVLVFVVATDPELRSSVPLEDEYNLDPSLKPMQYQLSGEPLRTTLVYQPPNVTTMYFPEGTAPAHTIVVPKFDGLAGKFINLSPDPIKLYFEREVGDFQKGSATITRFLPPFSAKGSGTHVGHIFVFATQQDTFLKRFRVNPAPDNIYTYDPYHGDLQLAQNLLSNQQQQQQQQDFISYKRWIQTLEFNRFYKRFTGRSYLATFQRPRPQHWMWPAHHFGQQHWIETHEVFYQSIPDDISLPSPELPPNQNRWHSDHRQQQQQQQHTENNNNNNSTTATSPHQTMSLVLRVLSCQPRVFEIEHFLSPVEIEHLLTHGTDLRASSVGDDSDHKTNTTTSRNSQNTWIPREQSVVLDSIYRRAADLLRIDEKRMRKHDGNKPSIAEQLQLVHYDPGQLYYAHHDFAFAPLSDEVQSTRFATLLLYLNEGMVGGETSFPRYSNAHTFEALKVRPTPGKAVLFYNLLPDGNPDDLSHHYAHMVQSGEKWLANLWVWDPHRI